MIHELQYLSKWALERVLEATREAGSRLLVRYYAQICIAHWKGNGALVNPPGETLGLV